MINECEIIGLFEPFVSENRFMPLHTVEGCEDKGQPLFLRLPFLCANVFSRPDRRHGNPTSSIRGGHLPWLSSVFTHTHKVQ